MSDPRPSTQPPRSVSALMRQAMQSGQFSGGPVRIVINSGSDSGGVRASVSTNGIPSFLPGVQVRTMRPPPSPIATGGGSGGNGNGRGGRSERSTSRVQQTTARAGSRHTGPESSAAESRTRAASWPTEEAAALDTRREPSSRGTQPAASPVEMPHWTFVDPSSSTNASGLRRAQGAPTPRNMFDGFSSLPFAAGFLHALHGSRESSNRSNRRTGSAGTGPGRGGADSPPAPDMDRLFGAMFGGGGGGGGPDDDDDDDDMLAPSQFFEAFLGSIMSGMHQPPDNSTAKATIDQLPHFFLLPDGNDDNNGSSGMASSSSTSKRAQEVPLETLKVSEIKRRLTLHGVKYTGLIEKSELVHALKTAEEAEAKNGGGADPGKPQRVAAARAQRTCISECFAPGTDRTCTICLDDFKEGQVVTQLPGCKHWFHLGEASSSSCSQSKPPGDGEDCCPGILKWLEKQSACPNCKAELPKERDASSDDFINTTSAASTSAAASSSSGASGTAAAAAAADASWSEGRPARRSTRRNSSTSSSSSTSTSASSTTPASSSRVPRTTRSRTDTPSPSAHEPAVKRSRRS